MEINQIIASIVDAAMKVHTALGPGLLESAYEGGYRIDLLVENLVVVELKVVEQILDLHKAQLLSYLKLSNKQLGLLINLMWYTCARESAG